jgi:hypothetical protein
LVVPFPGGRSRRTGKAARSRRLGLAGVDLRQTWTARRYFVHGEVRVLIASFQPAFTSRGINIV